MQNEFDKAAVLHALENLKQSWTTEMISDLHFQLTIYLQELDGYITSEEEDDLPPWDTGTEL